MPAIVFDFDGTLTYDSPNIWKRLWKDLGYSTGTGSYFSCLFIQFMLGKIDHKEWCDLSCEEFMKKGLSKQHIKPIVDEIKLINGIQETFKTLHDNGFSIHIVSGNFKDVIRTVLGENAKYCSSINGNEFVYDKDGKVKGIIDTKYDFSGKAEFIKEYMKKHHLNPSEMFFVGNGDNDEWAHKSGCKTICINPDNTDHTDRVKWKSSIPVCTNLTQILDEIPQIKHQQSTKHKTYGTALMVKPSIQPQALKNSREK